MPDNVLSTEASDTAYDVERDESPYPTEDNTQDHDHQRTIPLGVEVTGYHLFTTGVILGIGVPKAVYSYKGQALISTTLDWSGGVILALIFFWLGVIEARRPELFPRFFQVDLAPPILGFLCRPEVLLWSLSALPLLLSMTLLRAMLDAVRNHVHASDIPTFVVKDGLAMSVLASSTAICIFCLQCVRVIWPRVFRVGTIRHASLFIINSVIWLAYGAYVVVKIVWHRKDYPPSMVKIAVHGILWMYPVTLLPVSKQLLDTREGYSSLLRSSHLMMAVYLVFAEAVLIGVWGFPDFPEGLYGISFVWCLVVFFLYHFFASIPNSLVPSFAHIWSASKAAYDRARSTGNKAWTHVLGIGR